MVSADQICQSCLSRFYSNKHEMQMKYILLKIISVWKSMPGYVCIKIGTGKLLGKLLANGDNFSYVNLVCSQMWLKRLKTKRTQSTLNINTFSSNQTLKWEHNLAWLLLARALPCMKWFGPLSSAIFTPITISTSMHCRCDKKGHAHKGLPLGLT